MLTHTISSDKVVRGVTLLNNQVFLVRDWSSQIEVYDAETVTLQRHLTVTGLCKPWDIESCVNYNCLYVADGKSNYKVHKVVVREDSIFLTIWPMNDWPYGLSVKTGDCNVIVTFREARKIHEYTPAGLLFREVQLEATITNPMHAIKIVFSPTDEKFVVSHGYYKWDWHGVRIVNVDGRTTTKSYGIRGSSYGRLYVPVRMVLDPYGNVIVVDRCNRRVVLLNRSLEYVEDLLTMQDADGYWDPRRVYLDEERRRLYVTDNQIGCVLVFRFDFDASHRGESLMSPEV